MHPAFLERLANSQRVLLVGAGGGFDIYCGLPLFENLRSQGKQVFLASLNFRSPAPEWGPKVFPGVVCLQGDVSTDLVSAEVCLSRFLVAEHMDTAVYCFEAQGVLGLLECYRSLAYALAIDAIVLVDGGTDILLRGDEPSLGSPGEDVASLGAAFLLDVPTKLVASLGFGLDAHHGVCHAYVLEAAAELTKTGDFLGAISLLPLDRGLRLLERAVEFVKNQPGARPSIITGSVVAAALGEFGDVHVSDRTRGSELFINPLMSMYWSFTVEGLAHRCLYLDEILKTRTRGEVTLAIQRFRSKCSKRKWRPLQF